MRYAYRAVDADGRIVSGRIEARDDGDLDSRLHRRGLELLTARGAAGRRRRLSRRGQIAFCFHLEQLLAAGVPMLEALAELRDGQGNAALCHSVAALIEDIEGGLPLSAALAAQGRTYGRLFVNLVAAGENSGSLPATFERLGASLRWEDEIAAQTRQLLLQPALIGAVVLATLAFLLFYLLPQLRPFIESAGHTLPLPTRALFAIADLPAAWWLLLLLLPGGLVIAFFRLLPRPRRDALLLRLPVAGPLLRRVALARFAGTFALLYAAGVPVIEALQTVRPTLANGALEAAVAAAEGEIRGGTPLAAAFASSGLFPRLVVRMLRVGEATGGLDAALRQVAYFYDREVREATARLQQLAGPALTLVLGLLLGGMMLAALAPIYDIVAGFSP